MLQDNSYKNILRIALPLFVSGFAHNSINLADTAFIGRLGVTELGAVGNSLLLYFIFFVIAMGLATGVQIMIGRRNGEEDYKAIGGLLSHSMYLLTAISVVLYALLKFGTPYLLYYIVQSEEIMYYSNLYLQARSWGIFFTIFNILFISFFIGITQTRVISYSVLITALSNIFLDYVLIFGNWGFPKWGVEGAAIASALAEALTGLFFLFYLFKYVDWKKYGLFENFDFDRQIFTRITQIGVPIMIQNFVSLSAWFVFFSMIEHLGEEELGISHIIRTIYMFLVIPIISFSDTANTLVSNLIGQGNKELVYPTIKRISILSVIFAAIVVQVNVFFPEAVIGIFTTDPAVVQATLPSLYVISCTIFLFAVAFVHFKAIAGTGNTTVGLFIELATVVIYLIVAAILIRLYEVEVHYAWCCEFLYFILLLSLSYFYLKSNKWQQKEI